MSDFRIEITSVRELEAFLTLVHGAQFASLSQPAARLRTATRKLAAALGASPHADPRPSGVPPMRHVLIPFLSLAADGLLHAADGVGSGSAVTAASVLADTISTMQTAETVEDAALTFIGTVPAMIKAAVDQAIGNGATLEQLAPFTALNADLSAKSAALTAALQPAPPPAV